MNKWAMYILYFILFLTICIVVNNIFSNINITEGYGGGHHGGSGHHGGGGHHGGRGYHGGGYHGGGYHGYYGNYNGYSLDITPVYIYDDYYIPYYYLPYYWYKKIFITTQ
jgi:uncharacterized membrane protein